MTKPLLILDVDGVVIRDPLLMAHMQHNVTEFVRKKLPQSKQPHKAAHVLYKKYGHTALGLGVSVKEFEDEVFDHSLISHLHTVLDSDTFQRDLVYLRPLCKEYDVRLFSNSPLIWTLPIASEFRAPVKIHKNHQFVKPDPRAYDMFPKTIPKYFVDDSLLNLRTADGLPLWKCIHFSDTVGTEFLTVQSVLELALQLRRLRRR